MRPDGPLDARVLIVGEAPGEWEEKYQKPFCGPSGHELDRMLHDAGILRSECLVTNLCHKRPPNGDTEYFFVRRKTPPNDGQSWARWGSGWALPCVTEGSAQLTELISKVKPKIVIPVGNLPLHALTGNWGVGKWRGSTLPTMLGNHEFITVPTFHPAVVMRSWADRRYVVHDLKRAVGVLRDGLNVPHYNFIIRPQFPQAVACLSNLMTLLRRAPVHISCDIETRAGQMACIGFATSRTEAFCIPLMCVERPEGYWSPSEELHLVRLMRHILSHPNARISGQNFVYDAQYIYRDWQVTPRLALDTMLTHHVCFPGTEKGLDVLSSLYCAHHVYWKDDGKEWSSKMGEDTLWSYNCMDCVRTFEIAEVLVDVVAQLNLHDQCLFQHQMWWHTFDTMARGVRIDTTQKARLSQELWQEAKAREAWITRTLGHPLNVKSPKQMKAFFYDDLQLPIRRKRGTGLPTLDDEALSALMVKEPLIRPLVRRIRELRSLGVFRSTFVEGQLDWDLRMRCSYNVAGTETFRFSSSENAFGGGINLQNVPKGGEVDDDGDDPLILPNVRKLFLPDEGYEIADMDLSSADLRVVVWEADEPEFKQMLAAGLDPYTEIAKEFYRDPRITKSDARRQKFKSFAHGTNYLGTPRGLATRLGLSVHEAERTQTWYFGRFPKIKLWQESLRSNLETTRTVRNAFGYRRFFFDRIEGTLFNQAAAWIPQSTVGLLINKVWDRILAHEPDVQVLLQIHDSLVMQYPIARAPYFRERLQELSRIVIPYVDPLVIPTGFKYSQASWGDCE